MSLVTKWIVSEPFEPIKYSPYSGYDDDEVIETFKRFNPDRKILFMSDNKNEAIAFYDKFIGAKK
jgi:hypothetical protein